MCHSGTGTHSSALSSPEILKINIPFFRFQRDLDLGIAMKWNARSAAFLTDRAGVMLLE